MAQATITVKYVNQPKQPGGRKGSVKTADGAYYSVWTEKLAGFQPNTIYDIEYEEETGNDGRVWKTISSATAKGAAAPMFSGRRGGGGGNAYRETSQRDAERMFVCSILNAAISAGKVDMESDALAQKVVMLRRVWGVTFGQEAASEKPSPTTPDNVADDHTTHASELIAELRRWKAVSGLEQWGASAGIKEQINGLDEANRERVRGAYAAHMRVLKDATPIKMAG